MTADRTGPFGENDRSDRGCDRNAQSDRFRTAVRFDRSDRFEICSSI
jgi:hypothetical protein